MVLINENTTTNESNVFTNDDVDGEEEKAVAAAAERPTNNQPKNQEKNEKCVNNKKALNLCETNNTKEEEISLFSRVEQVTREINIETAVTKTNNQQIKNEQKLNLNTKKNQSIDSSPDKLVRCDFGTNINNNNNRIVRGQTTTTSTSSESIYTDPLTTPGCVVEVNQCYLSETDAICGIEHHHHTTLQNLNISTEQPVKPSWKSRFDKLTTTRVDLFSSCTGGNLLLENSDDEMPFHTRNKIKPLENNEVQVSSSGGSGGSSSSENNIFNVSRVKKVELSEMLPKTNTDGKSTIII